MMWYLGYYVPFSGIAFLYCLRTSHVPEFRILSVDMFHDCLEMDNTRRKWANILPCPNWGSRNHDFNPSIVEERAQFSAPVCNTLFIYSLCILPTQCVHLFRSIQTVSSSSCLRKQNFRVVFWDRDLFCCLWALN